MIEFFKTRKQARDSKIGKVVDLRADGKEWGAYNLEKKTQEKSKRQWKKEQKAIQGQGLYDSREYKEIPVYYI